MAFQRMGSGASGGTLTATPIILSGVTTLNVNVGDLIVAFWDGEYAYNNVTSSNLNLVASYPSIYYSKVYEATDTTVTLGRPNNGYKAVLISLI